MWLTSLIIFGEVALEKITRPWPHTLKNKQIPEKKKKKKYFSYFFLFFLNGMSDRL